MNWPTVPLGEPLSSAELFTDGDWIETKDQDPGGDVRLVQLADIGVGQFLNRSARYLTSETARRLNCTYLRRGDLLLSRMPDPIGRCCVFPGDEKRCVTVVDACIIRPDSEVFDPRWLMHCLNSPTSRLQMDQFTTGTTRARISRRNLGKILVPVPPLDEQRRIAAILDKANALRAKRSQIRNYLNDLEQSIFDSMFGDQPKVALGPQLAFVTSGGRGWAKYYATARVGEPFIRSLDVQMNRISANELALVNAPVNAEAKRTRTKLGDVLLTITGSRIGRAAPLPDDLEGAYVSQHVAILRPLTDALTPEFLSAFLCSSTFGQRQISAAQYGQTKPGLNFEQIRDFRIPQAELPQQQEFRKRIAAVTQVRSDVDRAEDEIADLSSSLQFRAFSGEL